VKQTSRKFFRVGFSFSAIGLLASLSGNAFADSEENVSTAQGEVASVEREAAGVQLAVETAKAQRFTSEQRLANGELLFYMRDYTRASVVFSEILEEAKGTPSYPDALWLRGETYYASKEYLAARRDFRELIDNSGDSRFNQYLGRALSRLVDISLRINDPKSLQALFSKFNQVPASQADAGFLYSKGKAFYMNRDYNGASSAFSKIPDDSANAHQARYFEGLVALKLAQQSPVSVAGPDGKMRPPTVNYKKAIDTFKHVTDLPADTPEHAHVIDLSWMAIARLFYEMENYAQAAEAYSRVSRGSVEFDTMLYELAWVYVRSGDVQRAERALEILSVADPGSPLLGDGTLLRADLLLRAGSYAKALQLYMGVRDTYDPMRVKVDTFLDSTTDSSVYYERLSQQQLDALDQSGQLPPLALRWAREAEDGPIVFSVIDDLNTCKTLIKQSNIIVDKLTALTESANRVRSFPELAAGEEKALGLINRLSRARFVIARGLDNEEPKEIPGDLAAVRSERRELMAVIEGLPTNTADFAKREVDGSRQWNTLSQELTRRSGEVDYLQATINGLRRMLREDGQNGVARDANSLKRFNEELDNNEREIRQRQEDIATLRRQIEMGRAQIGIGDARYQNDASARVRFRDVLEREVKLVAAGGAGPNAANYAQRVQASLTQARVTEDKLAAVFGQFEAQVQRRIGELRDKISAEKTKIDVYSKQLATLDTEAKDLVGKVAKRNFELVRDKLRGIVLRADVGITEHAWELREEEMYRVRALQTERARQEQVLDEELREVLDDSGGENKPPAK